MIRIRCLPFMGSLRGEGDVLFSDQALMAVVSRVSRSKRFKKVQKSGVDFAAW